MNDSDHTCVVRIFVGPSQELYWQQTSKKAIELWQPTALQKRLYLHHQGEFQYHNCMVRTVHDSNYDGYSKVVKR